ncbi:MAG: YciI family protein [Spirochaetales bacterium]|nr:YciI family protein [Spirochaetales bacterium]
MKYLCAVFIDGGKMKTLSEDQRRELDRGTVEHDRSLAARGNLIMAHPLDGNSVTVRVRDGTMSVTDGPFAETREVLGGFVMVEATDMNEAIRLIGDNPIAEFSSIEVHGVVERDIHGVNRESAE